MNRVAFGSRLKRFRVSVCCNSDLLFLSPAAAAIRVSRLGHSHGYKQSLKSKKALHCTHWRSLK